jgi:WD40 repeat protein
VLRVSGLRRRWAARGKETATAMAWSPDGGRLAVVNTAGHLLVFDGETGAVRGQWVGHRGGALSLAWGPDGRLVSGGQDGVAQVWTPGEAAPRVLPTEGRWVGAVSWSKRGWIAVAVDDEVCFFDAEGRRLVGGGKHPSTVAGMALDPRTDGVVTCAYGGGWVWAPGVEGPTERFDHKGSMLALAPSPDGRWVAFGAQDASAVVWDRRGGVPLRMAGYAGKVLALAWGGSAPTLIAAGAGTMAAWEFDGAGPSGKGGVEMQVHEGRVRGVAFGRYGRAAVSAGEDGRLVLWAGASWTVREVDQVEQSLIGLAMRPDGRRVAVATIEAAVAAWDVGA